jgi:hypothetical protein
MIFRHKKTKQLLELKDDGGDIVSCYVLDDSCNRIITIEGGFQTEVFQKKNLFESVNVEQFKNRLAIRKLCSKPLFHLEAWQLLDEAVEIINWLELLNKSLQQEADESKEEGGM